MTVTETRSKALTLKAQTAADLMTEHVVSIPEDAPLHEAIAVLIDRGFSGAPVINEAGRPVGVISRSDILVHDRNSPAYAQRFMDKLLRPHKAYCKAFIDDIIIFSDDFGFYKQHLETIFALFEAKRIALSPTKSFIGYPNVELLGFYVDSLGLSTTEDRIQGFRD